MCQCGSHVTERQSPLIDSPARNYIKAQGSSLEENQSPFTKRMKEIAPTKATDVNYISYEILVKSFISLSHSFFPSVEEAGRW